MYNKADGHKYFGVYFLGMPTLTIRDPEIIRSILVKDFDHFVDRQLNLFDQASSSKTDKVMIIAFYNEIFKIKKIVFNKIIDYFLRLGPDS